jgi:PKD repeat protein
MSGQQLQRISITNEPNNVDVRSGMIVGGEPIDICVVNAQDPSRLVVFKIDPNTRTLFNISAGSGIPIPELKNPYGLCLYRRPSDGAIFAFGTTNGGDQRNIHQYRLMDDGAGKVTGVHVRAFGSTYIGSVMEGLVADDELGYVYAAEEDCCVHKFYADPALNNNTRLAVFAQGDGIDPDREGLGIYGCADGTGYILLSSQGNRRVKVYRREGDPGNPHSHTLVTTIYTPDVGGTDGLDVTNRPAGPNFPYGLLAKHNSTPKNFALIAWEDIAQTYLTICPDNVACDVAADFSSNVLSGCAPATVNFTDQSTGPVTSWSWNFGDGGTSSAQNPAHTYNAPGVYTVTLSAGSAVCNDTEKKTGYITISSVPTAAFAGNPTSGGAPLTVSFTDQSTGVPTSWAWDFGDGGTATTKNPSHQYASPGTYTVTLTASNACGSDNEIKVNYVTVSNCVPSNVARGKTATASSSSSGDPPSRAVDGSTSTKWKSNAGGTQWLEVDLGSTYETNNAIIRWDGSRRAKDFQFQYFNTSTSAWVTLYSKTNNGSSTSTLSFALTCAQRFRVYMTKGNSSRYGINELEIIGCPCTAAGSKANGASLQEPAHVIPDLNRAAAKLSQPVQPQHNLPLQLATGDVRHIESLQRARRGSGHTGE